MLKVYNYFKLKREIFVADFKFTNVLLIIAWIISGALMKRQYRIVAGSFRLAIMRQFSMSPLRRCPHTKIKWCRIVRKIRAAHPPPSGVAGRGAGGLLEIHPVSPETGDILFGSVIPRVISRVCFLSL